MINPLSIIFNIFPIKKKRVVFSNFNGLGYGCNPKYITEELHRQHINCEIIWLSKKKDANFPAYVKVVKWGSLYSLYMWSTAEIIINNVRMGGYFKHGFKKKKGQFYIQTWHGSMGIKKMEADNNKLDLKYIEKAKLDSKNIDLLLSNSRWLTACLKKCFFYNGVILTCGSPRNDIFFNDKINKKDLKSKIGIKDNIEKIVSYVPTFGNITNVAQIYNNAQIICKSFESKFGGKWVLGIRLHPKERDIRIKNNKIINFNEIDDIQELLLVSDALITDFSSCAFDYIIYKKPVFIFATIDQISKADLYYDYDKTPFKVAHSIEELSKNIELFDSITYTRKINKFLFSMGNHDDGQASRRVVNIIKNKFKINN
jgi:CDP-glycerol glycerophosphotransferase